MLKNTTWWEAERNVQPGRCLVWISTGHCWLWEETITCSSKQAPPCRPEQSKAPEMSSHGFRGLYYKTDNEQDDGENFSTSQCWKLEVRPAPAWTASSWQWPRVLHAEYFRIFVPALTARLLFSSNSMLSSRTSVSPSISHRAGSSKMRLGPVSLVLLLGIVAARKEILKRQGDYFLRLHNNGGNLVLDEGEGNQKGLCMIIHWLQVMWFSENFRWEHQTCTSGRRELLTREISKSFWRYKNAIFEIQYL